MTDFQPLKSILYVEDDKATQDELRSFLQAYCEFLYVANHGEEGITLFKRYQPELVISDIAMPVMSGLVMMHEIRKLDTDVPVIFLTAYSDKDYLHEAISVHADGYIDKPIDLDNLENSLRRATQTLNLKKILKQKTEQELKQKERLETIFNTSQDGLVVVSHDGKIKYGNQRYIELFGYSPEELVEMSCEDMTINKNQQASCDLLAQVQLDGQVEGFVKDCRTKQGDFLTVEIAAAKIPKTHDILLSVRDITAKRAGEQQIRQYLKMIDENVITSSTDLHGFITSASQAFCKLSGYEKSELIGKNHNILRHPDMPESLYKTLWQTLEANQTWQGEMKNCAKNGEDYWVRAEISPSFDQQGNKVGYISVRENITYLKQVEELSTVDPLTDVYNRRAFNTIFPKFIQTSKRHDEFICFAFADIDFFKGYNDFYGHQEGDHALQKVAQTIKTFFKRGDDYVFRLGGEEFGMLFRVKQCDDAKVLLTNLLNEVEGLKIENQKSKVSEFVTLSMGALFFFQ